MQKVMGWSELASQKEDFHLVCYLRYLDVSIDINERARIQTFTVFFPL